MSETRSQGWKVFQSLRARFLCWLLFRLKNSVIFQLSMGGLSGLHLAHSYSVGTVQKPSSEVFVSLSASAPWIICCCLLLLEGVCCLSHGALCKLVSCLVVVHVPILLPYVCLSIQTGGEGCRKALFHVPSNKNKASYIKNHLCSTETSRLDGTGRPNPTLCYWNISYSTFCSQVISLLSISA